MTANCCDLFLTKDGFQNNMIRGNWTVAYSTEKLIMLFIRKSSPLSFAGEGLVFFFSSCLLAIAINISFISSSEANRSGSDVNHSF